MAQEDSLQTRSDRAALTFSRHLQSEDGLPDESFEVAWRDARQILEDAGPQASFILLVAHRPNPDDLTDLTAYSKFALSTGKHKIGGGDMLLMATDWIMELYG